jgi:membrane protease YdiL (CAAX protease family)
VEAAPGSDRRVPLLVGVLLPVLLAYNNVVVPLLPDHAAAYVSANVAATGLLLAAARWSGLSWAELGLARSRLRAGLGWGLACAALVAVAYLLPLLVPALRPLLGDARGSGADAGEVAQRVLVQIPFGTVVWEEVAFRGVLLAALLRLLPVRRAAAVSALVFGVWHVRPTLSGLDANDLGDGSLARAVAVVAVCAFTAAAGLLLAELRLRSGSLLAPALLHLAANTLGVLAGAAARGLDR